MYIINLKYAHLTSVFRQHDIHLVSSTCQHKYKWILCTEKLVLNASFQDFWCTKINNHLFCFEKMITTYLKAKNSLHATRISSFKCVFIVFFEKKTDAKIYIKSLLFWIKTSQYNLNVFPNFVQQTDPTFID